VTDKKSYLYARTFATTTDATVPLAEAMLKGYSDAGIQGTIKHFPGYGNIADDPHRNTAGSKDVSLYEKGLEPFKRLLQNKSDGAVMTAHIVIPGIDTKPATFSVYFLKDLLRKQWNYQGVIITDDLEMTSAGKKSIPDLAVEAVQAGNDMIISTPTASVHAKIHGAIKKAVLEGKIPLADIDASVERILRFKGYQLKR
jgi:beta-N-acetylhexosaminidase